MAWTGIRAGDLLVQAGEIEEGRSAYEAVLEHGSEALRPLAMTALGSLHRARQDWPAARAAYKAAIESGDPDAAPMAALNLGGLEAFYGN
ncbi:tetratricopeptide repeat protein [Actinoplanes sp. NPDC051470]|uniref:tetratricopeptide repeat protein n=1 Tax=unclassified Actinoplanes TaxID=2626549 RepID=UPI0034476503